MPDPQQHNLEPTAVDDVRRARENIARQHAGDIRQHIEETNRIAADLRAKLNIKLVPPPAPSPKRAGGI